MDGIASLSLAQDGRSTKAMKEHLNGRRGTKNESMDSKGAEDGEKKQCQALCKHGPGCILTLQKMRCLCHGNSASSLNRIKRKQAAISEPMD